MTKEKYNFIDVSKKYCDCPVCQSRCKRHSSVVKSIKDLGENSPLILKINHSKHYCENCEKYFSIPIDSLVRHNRRYSNKVYDTAIELIVNEKATLSKTRKTMKDKFFVDIPETTLHGWFKEHMNKKLALI